jgi:hypothetical protein
MTVTISGTSGISGADGSASTPAFQGTDTNTGIYFPGADRIGFTEGGVQVGEFDASGNFQFNSGYGSVATAYGCRAWVNFNGTGTVAIRGSGNVTSITDNGTGDYTVNFTNAMPDANYAISISGGSSSTIAAGTGWTAVYSGVEATTSCRVLSGTWSTSRIQQDAPTMCVSIFR